MISPPLTEFAPAKINLALHVTGKRADGYHLLDSLVVFAGVGDRLHVNPAPALRLRVMGPRADGVPDNADNLVLRAARWLDPCKGADIVLEKHLPHAAGIGGGSADAAATFRALATLWECPQPAPADTAALGADVPVCLVGTPSRMSGIGDRLGPVPPLPPVHLVLANPGVAVPTAAVFRTLARADNPGLAAPDWHTPQSFLTWLSQQRNDLEAPATALAPEISEVLTSLQGQTDCLLARMSGSGATCFGLFPTRAAAQRAAERMAIHAPNWWVAAAPIL